MAKVIARKKAEKVSGDMVKEQETNSMKAARKLITQKNGIEEAKEKMEEIGRELIQAMKKENRSRIFVDGFTLTVKLVEAKERIQIQKPRV
jgi:GMP synthase PP-ATPase subunit